jgi:S-adenosylmethionine:tRNA ribosyltransferase-isomerase
VLTPDFDFVLPENLIAQHPVEARDSSRLLVLHRQKSQIEHRLFRDVIQFFRNGDVLVLNNSKVIPARLRALNPTTRGAFEILLLEENSRNDWWAMMRPAKRARVGSKLVLIDLHGQQSDVVATVIDTNEAGHRRLSIERATSVPLALPDEFNIADLLDEYGAVPLPPYIRRAVGNSSTEDRARYQTVYAQEKGSSAAPTAGLHFSTELLSEIRARDIEVCSVTLHVGPGTFAPVKADCIEDHTMHWERFHVDESAAEKINLAKAEGRRVIAVGTTSVRVLETLALQNDGKMIAGAGRTNIFIYPPFPFQIVDALITNFHLPRSTLLMLVSAFTTPNEIHGRETLLAAYAEAVCQHYRFFSYGDAMLIT